MSHEVYASFYSCLQPRLKVFAVKVGHSERTLARAKELLSNLQLEDVFSTRSLSRRKALTLESEINTDLLRIANSGGSGEFHLYPLPQFSKVYKSIRSYFPEVINHQPNASLVSVSSIGLDYPSTSFPQTKALKKNYV